MLPSMRLLSYLFLILTFIFPCATLADTKINIPILVYHNLSMIPGSMNMTPAKVEAEIKLLKDNGFTIIPLKEAVEYLQGTRASLPSKAVVITADDGWESDYKYLFPIVKKYNIPVTLFIYPETISAGKNALTWDQLKEMQATGLFDVQGHTYSHPNFKVMKRHLSPDKYATFVTKELVSSKKILEDKMNKKIDYLAWPFGIYDDYLEAQAANAGYVMAFTIDARTANKSFKPMAQPRFMIIDAQNMKMFANIVNRASSQPTVSAKND